MAPYRGGICQDCCGGAHDACELATDVAIDSMAVDVQFDASARIRKADVFISKKIFPWFARDWRRRWFAGCGSRKLLHQRANFRSGLDCAASRRVAG